MVDHAGGGDETREVHSMGHGSFATTAGQMGDLVPQAPTATQGGAEPVKIIDDIVDEWGMQSFPASDPPSNW